ncbi:MAG TPA: histidine kinase N-terminal 7TM domain-containing protein [Herpetosiphonaceae bacterium]
MNWHYSPYVFVLLIAACVSIGIAGYTWRRRTAQGAPAFAVVMLAVAEVMLAFALELSSSDIPTKIVWAKAQYVGLVTIPVAWLIFALRYSQRSHWITWRNDMLLLIVPAITLTLVVSNESHSLIWYEPTVFADDPLNDLHVRYGPWFWVHMAYSYTLLLLGSVLLIGKLLHAPRLHRQPINLLLAAVIIPLVSSTLYIFNASPFSHLNVTPFALMLTGIAFAWGLFRFRLLDITPLARDTIFQNMYAGVIVLDTQRRIVDINPSAQRLFGWSPAHVVGHKLEEIRPSIAAVLPPGVQGQSIRKTVVLEDDYPQRIFDLNFSFLASQHGYPAGCMAVLLDISEHKRGEERYRVVSELTSDFTYALLAYPNGDLDLDWITDAFYRITDYSDEEVRARGGWYTLTYPDDHPVTQAHIRRLLAGQADVAEFRIVAKNGDLLWIRNYGQPRRDEEQRVVQILGAGQNITASRQAEAALRESEERYRRLVEYSPEPIVVHSEGKLVYVNAAGVKLYGACRREELIGKPIHDFIHPDYREVALRRDHTIHQASNPTELIEEKIVRLDGQSIDVEIAAIPITYLGKPALQVVARDITARKRVEEALREQNEYFAALHDTALAVMNRLELADVLEAIVVRAGALVGTEHGYLYSGEPNSGTSEIKVGVGIFRSYVGQRLRPGVGVDGSVWLTGQPLAVNNYQEWPGQVTDEPHKGLHAVVGVPLTSGPHVVGVLGLAHLEPGWSFGDEEITILTRFAELASIALVNARLYTTAQQELAERKRTEEKLALARDEALEAARLKSEFLATMSHELRTPLNAIIGFTDLTLEQHTGPLNDQQRSNLQRVSRNARSLLDLIDGILDLSKIDAGRMQMLSEPVRLYEVVSSAVSSIETLVSKKELEVTITQTPSGQPLIYGDSRRLRQIVLNLLSNAVKFTPANGRITVVLEHGPPTMLNMAALPDNDLPQGEWIALSVHDTGIGIPPEEHGRIWGEFYQIDGSLTRQYGGTGLGLTIVRRLTELMGGRVGLRSEVDEGSTFTIWLPVAQSSAEPPLDQPAMAPESEVPVTE